MTSINFITEWSKHHSARDKLTLPDLISSVLIPCHRRAPDSTSGEPFFPKTLLSNQLQGYKCWVLNIRYMGVGINFRFFSFQVPRELGWLDWTALKQFGIRNQWDLKQSSVSVYRLHWFIVRAMCWVAKPYCISDLTGRTIWFVITNRDVTKLVSHILYADEVTLRFPFVDLHSP